MSRFFLEFLTRDACHLCREAEPVVAKVARLTGAELRRIDVNAYPELAVDYGLRIPVVRGPSGRVLAEGRVRPGRLVWEATKERLRRPLSGRPGRGG